MSSPGAGLRERLRGSTQALHDRVDAQMNEQASFRSLAGYRRFLRCMVEALDEFQAPLDASSLAAGLETRTQWLQDCLRADLTAIGDKPDQNPEAPSSGAPCTPQAWGVGYALEGSAMGSRVLRKMAREQLGEQVPSAFLVASAEGATTRWPIYVKALETAAPDPALAELGAQSVFRSLLAILDQTKRQPSEID